MSVALHISPNPSLFIRDPQSTPTGRNLLRYAVPLMEKLGFEKFTFRKLAAEMGASEITIYRYFENKHKLLLYLLSWYWEWVKYAILLNTQNVDSAEERLRIAIRTVIESNRRDPLVEYMDEEALFSVVVEESEKAYHTKYVDQENKEGYFLTLKSLKSEIAGIIQAIRPSYPYTNSLASTILEMSSSLRFYAQHLPSLSDVTELNELDDQLYFYLESLVFSALR
jgi:AcrR family transcriptional regulator